MQVKELQNDGLKREYEITLAAGEISKTFDVKLAEYCKKVKMPGFRPGKVPFQVVKKKYGQSILVEVVEKSVADSSRKMISERELRPAIEPKIENISFDFEKENSDLVYNIAFEIYPDVPEVDLSSLSIDSYIVDIDDKEVDEAIERLKQSQKNFILANEDKAAQNGDAVLIDFLGKVADKPFDGGAGKDFKLELGSGQFIPGFEDQLVGAKKGSKIDVKVTFPEKYGSADLAGKDAVFEVTVHEVLEVQLPALDDDFAKKFGIDSVEKLKDIVKEQISADYNEIVGTKIKKEMIDLLDKGYNFTVPEGMVSMEFDIIKKSAGNVAKQDSDDSEKVLSQDLEYKKIAERRVRVGMILATIGDRNGIAVTEEEMRKAVFEQAKRYPGQEMKVLEFYQKNKDALQSLRGPVLENKVVDYIKSKIKLVEKKITTKELLKFEAGEE